MEVRNKEDIFRGYGIEIYLNTPEDFLKVAETLTRVGVPAKNEKSLYQTCHILHKRGRYAIVHFKELLALDGNETNYSQEDQDRRDKIVALLEQWKLVQLDPTHELADTSVKVKVIPFSEKRQWTLIPKYTIGKKK